jgi:hypothetical protein
MAADGGSRRSKTALEETALLLTTLFLERLPDQ